jgi:hypothetical protein
MVHPWKRIVGFPFNTLVLLALLVAVAMLV